LKKVETHVADALQKGAKVLTGAKRHALGGTFYEPTVLIDASKSMLVAGEETFGPVAVCFRFKTEEEAIAAANDTPFGLSAYFYTRDLGRAWRVAEALESGMVAVNEGISRPKWRRSAVSRNRVWAAKARSTGSMSIWN
jgi:succinate-semialdehyde dehydrogenase/glutarate-semialdehyde dehydrogenase